MTAPTIPGGATQAVQTQAGTYNFTTAWYTFFQSLLGFASGLLTGGSFTASAAASTVVAQAAITASSKVFLQATNPLAGTLMGSTKSLYVSALNPGVGFTVTTASGVAAAGTETFNYVVFG
jgi:hypothetical protein